jgi:hypothetical protein
MSALHKLIHKLEIQTDAGSSQQEALNTIADLVLTEDDTDAFVQKLHKLIAAIQNERARLPARE